MVLCLLGLPGVAFLSLFPRPIRKCLRGLSMGTCSSSMRWRRAWNWTWMHRDPVLCFKTETCRRHCSWGSIGIALASWHFSYVPSHLERQSQNGPWKQLTTWKKRERTQWQSAVSSLPGKGSPAVSRCFSSKMLLLCASPLRNLVLCSLLWIQIVRSIPCKRAWLIRTLS